MHISSSLISQNVAFTLGYSTITLKDGISAFLHNTALRNNSAISGGTMFAEKRCSITLTTCTFSSNKAITGKKPTLLKNSNVEMSLPPWSPTSFNQTWLPNQNPKSLSEKQQRSSKGLTSRHFHQNSIRTFAPKRNATYHINHLINSSILRNDVWQGYLPGIGGAVVVVTQSNLVLKNCTFADNLAQFMGGVIIAGLSVTLNVQETTFVRNTALIQGGAIDVEQQTHLRITNCVFDNNLSQGNGGAISGERNTTIDIQVTSFTRNNASQGGAIDTDTQSYLRMTDCTFKDNHAEQNGGAISGHKEVVFEIQETNFTRNTAVQGGAISVDTDVYLRATDSTFVDDHASQIGGAIYGGPDAVLEIQRTNFTGNSARQGGAINVQQQSNLSLINCRLKRNFASDVSGAILVATNVTLEIRETNFTGNSASHAGAAWVLQSQCHVVQSVFHSNTAKTRGGAVHILSKSSLKLENTNFLNNSGSDGGAIYIESTSKLQANMCIFSENFAEESGGAIKSNNYATAVIENCHFLAHYAEAGADGAVNINNPEHASIRDTFFLRNEASGDGGAISIGVGTVTIDNITCVGNHATGYGGCLCIDAATLTLNNS